MAHGNFDDALTLNPDGTLTVCGPIQWAGTPPDLKATSIEITLLVISQRTWGGRLVIGTHTPAAKFTPADTPPDEWMLDVSDIHDLGGPVSGREGFEAGPAHALAVVRVEQQGRNRIATEMWSETVHLS
jgi:hypothetical protein